MYIWAILVALLFTFAMCWLALLNQTLIEIVLPPGSRTLGVYVWELILSTAAATAIFIGIIALFKGASRRRWEKEVDKRIEDIKTKLEGLAGKLEDIEMKISLPSEKEEEVVAEEVPTEGKG
ncbi:hypothetical protein H5T87_02715 [bacterium]|nr:hypothetical protein [bacterium]